MFSKYTLKQLSVFYHPGKQIQLLCVWGIPDFVSSVLCHLQQKECFMCDALSSLTGVKFARSAPYTPRDNRCVSQYQRSLCSPSFWLLWLPSKALHPDSRTNRRTVRVFCEDRQINGQLYIYQSDVCSASALHCKYPSTYFVTSLYFLLDPAAWNQEAYRSQVCYIDPRFVKCSMPFYFSSIAFIAFHL